TYNGYKFLGSNLIYLKKLDFGFSDHITGEVLRVLPVSLEKLIIWLCKNLKDDAISSNIQHLTNLKALKLHYLSYIRDSSLTNLPSQLQALTISNCYELTNEGFKNLPPGLK